MASRQKRLRARRHYQYGGWSFRRSKNRPTPIRTRQPIHRPNPFRRFKNRFFPPRQYRPQYRGQVLYSPRFEQNQRPPRMKRLGPITRMRHYFDRDVVEFEKRPRRKNKQQFMGGLTGLGGE